MVKDKSMYKIIFSARRNDPRRNERDETIRGEMTGNEITRSQHNTNMIIII
jgi:hypothetical protein